jgi:hypothetical protein
MQAALLQQLSDPDGVSSTGKVQQRCLYYSSCQIRMDSSNLLACVGLMAGHCIWVHLHH